jgi:hypothetical protein
MAEWSQKPGEHDATISYSTTRWIAIGQLVAAA